MNSGDNISQLGDGYNYDLTAIRLQFDDAKTILRYPPPLSGLLH